MSKHFLAVAVLTSASAINFVSTVSAASPNLVSSFRNTNSNAYEMTNLQLREILSRQPKLIALPNCNVDEPPPICGGEPRPRPRPRPNSNPTPAPIQNYPAALSFLLQNSNLLQQVINTTWSEFGKGVAAQKIKDELNGKRVSGRKIKEVNVNLGDITENQVTVVSGLNQVNVRLFIPNNNENFRVDVPILPDPSFRVSHDITVNLKITVDQSNDPIKVDELTVQITNSRIRGSNIIGTIIKAVADFFTGGGFSNNITSRINQDIPLKNQLASYIKSATDRLPIPRN